MAWFCVHAVMRVEFEDGFPGEIPVWENIYLIEAGSPQEAREKGETRARRSEGNSSGSFFWNDHPANWVFVGIRKVISCEDEERQPASGTELTYSQYRLKTESDLKNFVQGAEVSLVYED